MLLITVCLFLVSTDDDVVESKKISLRDQAIKAFDEDGDGRLNAKERETLRKSGKRFGPPRPKYKRGGGKRVEFDPATLKKYDKDKDGKLSKKEYDEAIGAVYRKWVELVGKYKAFKDDKPMVPALKEMERDAKAGKIKDFPPVLYGWIRGSIDRAKWSGRKDGPRGHILAQFDTNKDGRLSAKELAAVRKAMADTQKTDLK